MASPFQAATTLSSRAGWAGSARHVQQPGPRPQPPLALGRRQCIDVEQQPQGRGAVLEGAGLGDAGQVGDPRPVGVAEHLAQLGRRPDVGEPLDPGPAASTACPRPGWRPARPGRAQPGQHPLAGLDRDPAAERVAGQPPPVQVGPGQQTIVVQHLFEVRHHPGGVDAVAREAAVELVVHPAARHRPAGGRRHLQRSSPEPSAPRRRPRGMPEQPLEHHRRRELGRTAETASRSVEPALQGRRRPRPARPPTSAGRPPGRRAWPAPR